MWKKIIKFSKRKTIEQKQSIKQKPTELSAGFNYLYSFSFISYWNDTKSLILQSKIYASLASVSIVMIFPFRILYKVLCGMPYVISLYPEIPC